MKKTRPVSQDKLKDVIVANTNLTIKQAKKDANTLIIQTAIDLAEKIQIKKLL